ncbi:hypothetical protein [Methanosarcina lacustris]|uniref:hypothetical protein n=1 Tax=Methanosarcina lacustris TaxID=170861 RepID=UPI00064E2FA3|nr:hypothetical protein [Methanosarcina lacustris]
MVVQGVAWGLTLTIINEPLSKALKHAFSEGGKSDLNSVDIKIDNDGSSEINSFSRVMGD